MFKKILFLSGFLFCGYFVAAQTYPPKSTTLVTDFTNTLSAPDKQKLEDKLVAFDDTSSTQIAVVIIKSVGDYDINEYGAGLGRNWGIGQKGKNNGVLLLVAIDDHKMTIQTGYGVEGALPDAIAAQIRIKDINPRFKAGDYYGGLDVGTDDIIKYTKGEYKQDKPQDEAVQDDASDSNAGGIIALIIIVIIILVFIFRNRGGGGHIIGSRGGASPFWWFLGGSMLGGGGWGGGNDSGNGGGGDSGGGGDFGGFGGGDFGGGGSGGSW